MKWFKHDSDASTDAKIKKLIIRHGAVGYAVYFHCLELITADLSESHLTFELEHDSEIIADNLKIQGNGNQSGMEIVEKIMIDIISLGLFVENGNRIFCLKLAKRIDSSMTSNPSFRAKIKKSHDSIMIGSCRSPDTVMQEETIIEQKKLKEKILEKPKRKRFTPPTIEDIKSHCKEKGYNVNTDKFFYHYESNGWMVGRNKMKSWQMALGKWNTDSKPIKKEKAVDEIPEGMTALEFYGSPI